MPFGLLTESSVVMCTLESTGRHRGRRKSHLTPAHVKRVSHMTNKQGEHNELVAMSIQTEHPVYMSVDESVGQYIKFRCPIWETVESESWPFLCVLDFASRYSV